MSGIAGVFEPVLARCSLDLPDRLVSKLAHRGPDRQRRLIVSPDGAKLGDSLKNEPGTSALLVHTLLDSAEGGSALIGHEAYSAYVALDGAVTNASELRAELAQLGYRFKSTAQTEVLAAAYRHWGPEMPQRLRGGFALVIFDELRHEVFICRDHFGMRPLYFCTVAESLVVASEMKALLEINGVNKTPDFGSVYQFLRYGFSDLGERTIFDGIWQLRPAHCATIRLNGPTDVCPHRFWDIDFVSQIDVNFVEAARHVRELFMRSVSLNMRVNGTVGAGLSGGVDSSSIVCAMKCLADEDRPLKTFSYVASGSAVNEERWIDIVAREAGTESFRTSPGSDEVLASLVDLTYQQEEPLASASLVAQQRVHAMARDEGVNVILEGIGSDGFLGGHHYYIVDRVASYAERGEYGAALRLCKTVIDNPSIASRPMLLKLISLILPQALEEPARNVLGQGSFPKWIDGEWFTQRGVEAAPRTFKRGARPFHSHMYEGLTFGGTPRLLRYADRNASSVGVENRAPFLDPSLVQYVFGLPEGFILANDGTGKAVFKSAMRGLVPDQILDRQDKVGFGTPQNEWLKDQHLWIEQTFESGRARGIPINWDHIGDSTRAIKLVRPDVLWRILSLAIWAEVFDLQISS